MDLMHKEEGVQVEKPQKDDHRIRDTLADFSSNTTAHGFARLVAADSKIVKFLWILICCLCWGVFIWQAIVFIEKYYRFEVSYSISVDFRVLPFPAVTVCNMNPLRQSALENIDDKYKDLLEFLKSGAQSEDNAHADEESNSATSESENISKMMLMSEDDDDFDGESSPDFSLESEGFSDYSWEEPVDFDFDFTRELNLSMIMSHLPSEVRNKTGHQKEDLIQECVFNGIKCSSKNFTLVLNPKYGNCYSFNTGTNGADIVHTSKPGPSTGLRLTLYIEQDEYLNGITENAGAVVLVHPPDTVPFPEEQGLELPPGFSASLGIRLSVIDRIGGKYSDCIKAGEMPLLYEGYNYSVEACAKSCYQNKLIDECKCYDVTLPNNKSFPACIDGTKEAQRCMSGMNHRQKMDALDCRLNCHQPCSGRSFKETVSMSQWPSNAYDDTLYARLTQKSQKIKEQLISAEVSRRNLIKLKVYYSELNFESITERQAFGLVDLLSNLGGLMGLYIGASVMSLFEVLEFVGKVCYLLKPKRRVSDQANIGMQM
ncbi:amiloride-sensitive sodium channel subunit gamma-like [Ptychodera flava]|uniref:amiloride-sensitive sodium channel subunit gamma-like n=1 Tax=Ptychodera flava TaxID=63121 RepID=UPI003969D172